MEKSLNGLSSINGADHKAMMPICIHAQDTFSIEGVVIRSIRCHRPSYLLSSRRK